MKKDLLYVRSKPQGETPLGTQVRNYENKWQFNVM